MSNFLQDHASLGSPSLDEIQLSRFSARAKYVSLMVAERESYISNARADNEVFGTHWGREFLDTIARRISLGDQAILDRLRLIYNFSGFPIVSYRRSATFPVRDPAFERYLKLRAITPPRFRFSAPAICGEAGWIVDGGLVNVDVALAQERIQFMYFTGVLDWLIERNRPITVMEIGAGCGLMALAFVRSFPKALYLICDVPEVLAVSFAYLNLTLPEHRHVAVLPSGAWDVAAPNSEIDLSKITTGIAYIPNYMMHKCASKLKLDMAINAMSLHEMKEAQIRYYCGFMSAALAPNSGIYFDVNAHRGQPNRVNDDFLAAAFALRHDADLTELSLGARIWSNSNTTIELLRERSRQFREQHDLDAAFSVEYPYEIPRFDKQAAYRALNEDLGNLIGVDFEKWMKARNYGFADPIAGYRARHHFT